MQNAPIKKICLFLTIFICIILFSSNPCGADIIYLKNGKTLKREISSRNSGNLWVKQSGGSVGVDLKTIAKITDDNGDISKFDYEALGKAIKGFLKQKKYSEALKYCDLLLQSFPNHPNTRYLHGALSYKLGSLKDAQGDYEFLVKYKRANAKIFNDLGTIYASQKMYRDARSSFLRAISKSPAMIDAHYNLANVLLETKDYKGSIKEYEIALKSEPSNVTVLFNLGLAYDKSGNRSKARELWSKVLEIKPDDSDAKKALELSLSKAGQ